MRQIIEHLDLIIVKAGEKVQVDVAVHVVGEPAPGLEVDLDAKTLLIETLATQHPGAPGGGCEGLEAARRSSPRTSSFPPAARSSPSRTCSSLRSASAVEQDFGAEPEAAAEESAPAAGAAE